MIAAAWPARVACLAAAVLLAAAAEPPSRIKRLGINIEVKN